MILNGLFLYLFSFSFYASAVGSIEWKKINDTQSSFYIDDTNQDFKSAESSCRKNDGHLATIINLDYQQTIFKEAQEKNISSYWIGLTDYSKESAFEWTSGYPAVSAVFWRKVTTKGAEHLVDCIGVTVTDGQTTTNVNKSWSEMDCSVTQPSVCMKGGPPDNFRPIPMGEKKNGTCPDKFFRLNNRCLKIVDNEKKTWTEARKECQKLGKDGDLASILIQEEQNILSALMMEQNSDVWIGLRKTQIGSFQWARNYSVAYTHWKRGEPNGAFSHSNETDEIELCGMMYRRNTNPGEWNDVACKSKMGYICESDLLDKPDGSKQLPDPLFPPSTESSKCKADEHYYQDYCYWKGKSVKSFDEAEAECNKENKLSHLVSPHNLYEAAFLSAFIDKYKLDDTLLGYRVLLQKRNLQLVSADGIVLGIELLRGVDYSHVVNVSCLSTTRDDDQHVQMVACSLKNGSFEAVCRYPLNNASRHPDNYNYTCDAGWKKATGSRRCLKLFDSKVTFEEAEQSCVKYGGHLLSIHSIQDQSDATELARTAGSGLWIGLELTWDSDSDWKGHWTDKSPANFFHWRVGEPSERTTVKTENCVEMRHKSNDWNNVRCGKRKLYICYHDPKKVVPTSTASPTTTATTIPVTTPTSEDIDANTTVTSTEAPTTTKTTTTTKGTTTTATTATTTPVVSCPAGMIRNFDNCYQVIDSIETWKVAEKKCKKIGEHVQLASIHDLSENSLVTELVKKKLGSKKGAWIGLSDLYDKYDSGFTYWSDDSPISLPHFASNAKPSIFGDGGCVTIESDGLWYKRHCTYKRPYVCKYSTEKRPKPEPVTPQVGAKYCAKGFVKFRSSCYKLVRRPSVFNVAHDICKSLVDKKYKTVTNLARIDTFEDNEFLFSLLKLVGGKAAWIGLHFHQNEFHWSNNEPLQFSRWPVNMSYVDQSTACVAIGRSNLPQQTGYWFARSCSDPLPFICQAPLIVQKPKSPSVCPPGYQGYYEIDGSCYFLDSKPVTYEQAKAKCDNKKLMNSNHGMTSSMLTLSSVYEMSYIRAWLTTSAVTDRPVWLGLNLKKGDHVWKWDNGHLVNFTYTNRFPDDTSGCFYLLVRRDNRRFGMQIDHKCSKSGVTVCKLSPRMEVAKARECRMTPDGATYLGHQTKTVSGRSCVRWDMIEDLHLVMKMGLSMPDGSVSSACNFCRYPPGVQKHIKVPFCFVSRGNSTHAPHAEACDIELCAQSAHGYVVVVAILVIVLLVTISFFVGVMVWKRTNTAQGFIPYLRQHDPEGGTSFHNPIYTPAATC